MTIFFLLLTVPMLLVVVTDATRYIIPNGLVGLVIALYAAMIYMQWAGGGITVDWKVGLIAGVGMFAVGFALFALKLMGGGDVKLLAAASLWTGVQALPEFAIWTALLGGALTVALLVARPVAFKVAKGKTLPRLLTKGAAVPYGLAIAAAFLKLLWEGKLPGLAV